MKDALTAIVAVLLTVLLCVAAVAGAFGLAWRACLWAVEPWLYS